MREFDITKDSLLTAEEICQKLSISRSTFERWRGSSDYIDGSGSTRSIFHTVTDSQDFVPRIPFPKPILNIGRSARWSANDINAWIQNLNKSLR